MGATLTTVIDMRKTAMNLRELVSQMTPDSEIIIADGEEPRARVVPIPPPLENKPRILGLHKDSGFLAIAPDAFDPLPDEFWLGEDEPAS